MGDPKRFTHEERVAALRLARSDEIGPITYKNLIERFGSACAAVDALPALASRGGRAAQLRLRSEREVETEIAAAESLGATYLVLGEADYPPLLAAADPPPPIIFVRGRIDSLSRSVIAIVGARNASANGRKLAEALAAGLGAKGHIVVSGLARGIDTAAHKGALATGTIAVLAGGIDQIYPEENAALFESILETGAAISEMPFGQVARAQDFPRRNRIIAGLARGTVVVEAAARSGSLITARLAAELGREVFSVPGSPLDARCQGSNQLLRDGAILTETVDDIEGNLPAAINHGPVLRVSNPVPRPQSKPTRSREGASPGSALAERLLELLGPSPTHIDELVRQTGRTAAEVQAVLLDLELEGLTLRHAGQAVSRAPEA